MPTDSFPLQWHGTSFVKGHVVLSSPRLALRSGFSTVYHAYWVESPDVPPVPVVLKRLEIRGQASRDAAHLERVRTNVAVAAIRE